MKEFYFKKKRNLAALGLAMLTFSVNAQNVGVGTTQPDQSAVLDISSSSKGLLIPRMTLDQRNGITAPATGLMIYQTGESEGFYYFDGKSWGTLTEANSVSADPNDWSFAGNTPPTGSFIGTNNAEPLIFKVNGNQSGNVGSNDGDITILGYRAALNNTGLYNTSIGMFSAFSNTTGNNNTALGYRGLFSVTAGSNNTALGAYSIYNNTGSGNIGIGAYTLAGTAGLSTGGNNLALGTFTLQGNTTGSGNTGLGFNALNANTEGADNLAVGQGALVLNTTGSGNVAIGAQALHDNVTGTGNVGIGPNAGYAELASDKLYIANDATVTPLIYGDFAAKFISVGDIELAKRDAIASSGSYGLLVEKGILTEKVKVALKASGDWADYVFEKDYKLMPLNEVESFIKENKHLPNVPSAEKMALDGLDVVKTTSKLMEKVEELTLYIIELNKEIESLKAQR